MKKTIYSAMLFALCLIAVTFVGCAKEELGVITEEVTQDVITDDVLHLSHDHGAHHPAHDLHHGDHDGDVGEHHDGDEHPHHAGDEHPHHEGDGHPHHATDTTGHHPGDGHHHGG